MAVWWRSSRGRSRNPIRIRLDSARAELAEADGPADDRDRMAALSLELAREARRDPLVASGGIRRRIVPAPPLGAAVRATGRREPHGGLHPFPARCGRPPAEAAPRTTWPIAGSAQIGEGRAFTTVGISHLTTSRRLGAQPVKAVEIAPGRYRLDGTIPWVTAADEQTCSSPARSWTTAGRC